MIPLHVRVEVAGLVTVFVHAFYYVITAWSLESRVLMFYIIMWFATHEYISAGDTHVPILDMLDSRIESTILSSAAIFLRWFLLTLTVFTQLSGLQGTILGYGFMLSVSRQCPSKPRPDLLNFNLGFDSSFPPPKTMSLQLLLRCWKERRKIHAASGHRCQQPEIPSCISDIYILFL